MKGRKVLCFHNANEGFIDAELVPVIKPKQGLV